MSARAVRGNRCCVVPAHADQTDLAMIGHQRLPREKGPKPVAVPLKRCASCRRSLSLTEFERRVNGRQGVSAQCKTCIERRYHTEEFGCSRCGRRLPGPAFFRGSTGSAIMQPCRECRSAARRAATRISRITHNRAPYHLLSGIDVDARTATCRECGPVSIFATGSKQGRGWRCATRSQELSAAWYDAKALVVDKHASVRWHRISAVRGDEMRSTCSLCGDVPVRWANSGGYFVCGSPTRRSKHAAAERKRRRPLLYGLSIENYKRMNQSQGGRCAICGGTQSRGDSDAGLVVDHDHVTGAVRALLCNLCNTGLGAMRDSPEIMLSAIDYLNARANREQPGRPPGAISAR